MKKTLVNMIVMMAILFSCKAQKIDPISIYGTFYKWDKDKYFSKSYTLELNQDGSFKLKINQLDANPQCQGKWGIVDNEILLECEEGKNPYEMLSSGYLSEREHRFQILSKNKLKYKDIVLKRKK